MNESLIVESLLLFTSLSAFGIVGTLEFGLFNKCVVVSYCCFTLQFPNDIGC